MNWYLQKMFSAIGRGILLKIVYAEKMDGFDCRWKMMAKFTCRRKVSIKEGKFWVPIVIYNDWYYSIMRYKHHWQTLSWKNQGNHQFIEGNNNCDNLSFKGSFCEDYMCCDGETHKSRSGSLSFMMENSLPAMHYYGVCSTFVL